MRRYALLAAITAAAVLLAGCSITPQDFSVTAECRNTVRVDNPVLVVMAQAVPTAQLIPCIQSIPAGWTQSDLDAQNGRAFFVLASSIDGPRAVTVTLTRDCDTRGASPVPTDEPGTRRYERPTRIDRGYAGERYYVYPGGCTTYRFDLNGPTHAQPVNEVSTAVGFVPRAAIQDEVRRDTDGRIDLDPSPTEIRR
jgi:hypothetical protein